MPTFRVQPEMNQATITPATRAIPGASARPPIEIVVVDDNATFLEAVSFRLIRGEGFRVVGTAKTVDSAIYVIGTHTPRVVAIDVRMPGIGGAGLARWVREHHPEIAIVALTVSREEGDLADMLHAGATGYVLKSDAHEELPRAVMAAVDGHAWLSPEMSRKLVSAYVDSAAGSIRSALGGCEDLTRRECAVLGEVAKGRTNREIAGRLYIAETTVKTHLKNIFAKLDVRNRSEAASFAWRTGLVGDEAPRG